MQQEEILLAIQEQLTKVLEDDATLFLVSMKVKPTNNFKIFIDGDNGFSIEKCIKVNRTLYKAIEEAGYFPEGDFSLEVSSPGVDEPLLLNRQYTKNIGRNIEITFQDKTTKEGVLKEVTPSDILLEHTIGKGKKAETSQLVIPFQNILKAIVQIKF